MNLNTIKARNANKLVKTVKVPGVTGKIVKIAGRYLSIRIYDVDGLSAIDNTHTSKNIAIARMHEMIENATERLARWANA